MIAAFEQRLADVLGARLPVPFRGRVSVPPAPGPAAQPAVVVAVEGAEAVEPDLGSRRPELAPGAGDPRRVLRLNCAVAVRVLAASNADRRQQLTGLDAAIYALDAPDLRDGSALRGDGDLGFLIQRMRPTHAAAPVDPTLATAPPLGITLLAEGWFWPAGVAGQAGVTIAEVRIRGAALPLTVAPSSPALVAGGPPVDLTLTFGATGTLQGRGPGLPAAHLPYGNLALTLEGPGGRPGAGTLSGGAPGQPGVRLTPVTGGTATVRYTPPAAPAVDELVIALDNGEGGAGIELGRFLLRVRAG